MKIKTDRLLIALIKICGLLPLWLCRFLGRILGIMLWLIPNRNRSITSANIKFCFPTLTKSAQQCLIFKSLQHTGMLSFEMAAVWQRPYAWLHQHIININNKESYDKALAENKGVILLLPHIGNWEIFGAYIPTLSPMTALYEPPKVKHLEQFIKTGREQHGANLVPTNQRGVAALLQHLRRGGTTCILPDQVPNRKDRGCVSAPFFGHPALTMTLVSQLARKTQCRVLGASAKRVSQGFIIEFWPLDNDIDSDDLQTSAASINRMVETCIRSMPEQYQWEYKRFKGVSNNKEIYS